MLKTECCIKPTLKGASAGIESQSVCVNSFAVALCFNHLVILKRTRGAIKSHSNEIRWKHLK